MSEKLIPFDFEAFKADPSRLRYDNGGHPDWAEPVRDCIAVHRDCCYTLYQPSYHHQFRLAAKTRKVGVRLFINPDGDVFARTSDGVDLYQADYCGNSWIGDTFEVEVPA